ncbi:zinc finger protein 883 isoform X1 [Agrilus planipennis]|uniref:Zinc finger protein 883 isoform X1 n=1 Tax=Agrilus planipennis TaxID=224129 RepID=A0A1W4WA17_AGRPL|nr:zinc finger protein 883 isoform X1 [Agrilus planipennis]XP_018320835.1 zinc finger protein 883 isoform X1 [Agrilus planipennis]XP_018320836.1 zinc finger protein 883 isoform X1 [Agrilus planipennis]
MEAWRTYATICRLCLQKDGFMLGIFNQIQGKEKSICRKIKEFIDLQISSGDGLPSLICHRCLYKIELCLEFKQQCFLADATLRQVNTLPDKDAVNFFEGNGNGENNVVMVVDPMSLDYESEGETENELQSDIEAHESNDFNEFRNVFMCKYCDQAFTTKNDCALHESTGHNSNIPYTCVNCNMGFADRSQYSAHLKSIHQNDKPYNCPECERTFARRSDLRKHTIVHTGVKPFTCTICLKSFSRNTNLSKHMRIHSGHKPFVCQLCPKTFISKADLSRHSIIHTGQKPFRCRYCHLNFGRRDKLIRHEKRHFPQQNIGDKSQELELMRQNLSLGNYSTLIKETENNEYNSHASENKQNDWSSQENMVISINPFHHNEFTNNEGTAGNDFHSEEQNISKNLNLSDSFIMSNNIENVNFEGNTPDRVSNDNEEFRGFENNKKTNGDAFKRHPCSLCNKKFSSSEGLRVHMTLHSLQRPFTCTICGKSFLRKRELDRHLATHTGMKPFKCSYCDKRFGRKDKLIRHFQIHNVKREHVCSVCGTSFIRRDGLTHHMKKHTQENSEENSFVVVAGNNLTS